MKKLACLFIFLLGCDAVPAHATVAVMENVRGTNNAYFINTTSSYTVIGSTIQASTATLTVNGNTSTNCIKFPSGFQCAPGITGGAVSSVNAGYGLTNSGTVSNPTLNWTNTGIASMTVVVATITTLSAPTINNVSTINGAAPGTVTGVTAGFGLTNSGTAAAPTLNWTNTSIASMTVTVSTITTLSVVTLTPTNLVGTTTGSNAAAGSVGEYVEGTQTTYTNYPTTNQYGDGTSISLTAGDWDVSAVMSTSLNGATTSNRFELGISSNTGNTSNNLTFGTTLVDTLPPTALAFSSAALPSIRFSLTTTTTLYLKVLAQYTAGNPQYVCHLYARRMR